MKTVVDREGASRYYDDRMQRDSDMLKSMFSVDADKAAKNRKRIAKKQRYSLTKASKTSDTCDLFQKSSRMARTQKIGVDGEPTRLTPVKPSGVMTLGGKLIPVRTAKRS